MTGYLLDTHIWYWYLVGSRKIPGAIRRKLDADLSSSWLSPISVWELAMLAAKGRVEIPADFRGWTTEAMRRMPLRSATMNFEVALKSQEIRLSHRDPADHFLAATALTYDLVLLTVDENLLGLEWLPASSG